MNFEIGEKLPIPADTQTQLKYIRPVLDGSGLMVCGFYDGLRQIDIDCWRKSSLVYGIFTDEVVPFFLVQMRHLFDIMFTVNLAVEDPETDREWMKPGNMVSFILCSYSDRIIRGMRLAKVDALLMNEFKAHCQNAFNELGLNFREKATEILAKYSTEDMCGKIEFISMRDWYCQ